MRRVSLFAFLLLISLSANADLECANYETNQQVTWLVNQDPQFTMIGLSVDVDHESQLVCLAWGAEKMYLKNNFPGLHWRTGQSTMIWQGDEARFIINNL